jgi:hypothetical protein
MIRVGRGGAVMMITAVVRWCNGCDGGSEDDGAGDDDNGDDDGGDGGRGDDDDDKAATLVTTCAHSPLIVGSKADANISLIALSKCRNITRELNKLSRRRTPLKRRKQNPKPVPSPRNIDCMAKNLQQTS